MLQATSIFTLTFSATIAKLNIHWHLKKVPYPVIRKIVLSTYLDVFGAVLVLGVSLARNFHRTVYYQGKPQFNIPLDQLWDLILMGAFPIGILSTVGAIFSLLSARLIGKQNNWGNFIGVITTINSGVLDFLFGNASAVITYPLTFFIMVYATRNWKQGVRIRDIDLQYYLINFSGILLGFGLVHLGAYLFGGITSSFFLLTVAVTFGLSIGANFCSALKYKETWLSWVIYNIVQLIKNTIQLNIANIAKYIFYLFNATVTLVDWKFNGDRNEVGGSDSSSNEVAANPV